MNTITEDVAVEIARLRKVNTELLRVMKACHNNLHEAITLSRLGKPLACSVIAECIYWMEEAIAKAEKL